MPAADANEALADGGMFYDESERGPIGSRIDCEIAIAVKVVIVVGV